MFLKKNQLVFGTHAIKEAVIAGKDIEKVLIKTGMRNSRTAELINILKKHNVPFQFVPVQKINSFTNANHQGVLALASPVKYFSLEQLVPFIFEQGQSPLLLITDGITDVRNFGAIARSAECAGASGILIPFKGTARINSDAIKTSAGALHHIPVCREERLTDSIDFLKQSGFKIFAASEKTDTNYTDADFTGPAAIILGDEELGISKDILEKADFPIKIPIFGKIESLNVSAAASVILYEVARQRKLDKS